MSMWRGKLDRKPEGRIVFGNAVTVAVLWGLGILGSLGCQPTAPVVAYNGTTFARRISPGALKIHRVSLPDEFYQDIGTVQITCPGQAQESAEPGHIAREGSGGCGSTAAMELARQRAASVGAHGLHSISSKPGASGNVVALNATAFRYTRSEHEPGAPSAEQPFEPAVAVMPSPGAAPTAEATAPAVPQEDVPPPPSSAPARPLPGRLTTVAGQPAPVYPPMRLAGNPPRALSAAAARPAVTPSAEGMAAPAPGAEPLATAQKPPLVIAPPPAVPQPVIPASPPGSLSAATLLPAAERLKRLKELKDKGMIPVQMYERRRKEILQGN